MQRCLVVVHRHVQRVDVARLFRVAATKVHPATVDLKPKNAEDDEHEEDDDDRVGQLRDRGEESVDEDPQLRDRRERPQRAKDADGTEDRTEEGCGGGLRRVVQGGLFGVEGGDGGYVSGDCKSAWRRGRW